MNKTKLSSSEISSVEGWAERWDEFKAILDQPVAYSAAELIGMVFGEDRPGLTSAERELLQHQAKNLAELEHGSLADMAACSVWEVVKLRSIFANYMHVMYHRDKKFDASDEILQRLRPKKFAEERARTAGLAKLAKDPKQKAKAEVEKLWLERHCGKHKKLRTNEQFAAECLRRWPVLTSSKVICGWCTTLTASVKSKKAQPAS